MKNFKNFNFLPEKKILKKLKDLRSQGYDSIHLPGGTSLGGNYYAGTIVPYYERKSKMMYFLVVPYNSFFHNSERNGHNKKRNELPDLTATRELLEETGLQVTEEDLYLALWKKVPDNRPGKQGAFHQKFYYLILEYSGVLLTFKGSNPIDAETAAPLWISADLLVKILFKGHKLALKNAMDILSEDKEFAIALIGAQAELYRQSII